MKKSSTFQDSEFTLAKFKNEIVAIGYLKDDSFYPKRLLNVY